MGMSMGPSVAQSIMMQLGSFQFSIATAAYQELTRRTESRWPSQERFGQLPALQFTGPGQDSITLAGTIYTEYVGSVFMLAKMRALAGRGRPLPLITGAGVTMGRWCIESVEEKQGVFTLDGAPRKQEFTLQLKLFDVRQAEQTGILAAVSAAASGVASSAAPATAAPTTVVGKVQAAVTGFAANAAKVASDVVKSATSAIATVQAKADEIGSAVGPIVSGVRTAVSTAQELQGTVNTLKANVKNIRSLGDLQSAVLSVSSVASSASNAGALASKLTGDFLPDLTANGAASDTLQVVKDCQATCGRSAVAASGIYSQGASLLNDAKRLFAND